MGTNYKAPRKTSNLLRTTSQSKLFYTLANNKMQYSYPSYLVLHQLIEEVCGSLEAKKVRHSAQKTT